MKILLCFLFSVAVAQEFDTIAFVQKWPLCKEKGECPIKDKDDERFLIDQILPFDRNTGKIASDCGPEEIFDMNGVQNVMDNLTNAWPNWPESEDGDNVWAKDWRSHGACLKNYMGGDENGYFRQALQWYADNNVTKTLKEKFMYPGLPLFAGRLLGSIDNSSINCRPDKSSWKSPILTHVAICYDTNNMSQVECGKLFGGRQGSCPEYGMVWWLHSKAEDRGKYSDNAKDDDSPYIILMNNQMPPTNEDDKFMLGTSAGMMAMAGLLCLFSVFTVFYITKMANKNEKNLV